MTTQRLPYLVFFLIAAAICCQLFLPPVVGMADNGDFARITGRFDLTNAAPALNGDRFFQYLIIKWKQDPAARWMSGFLTSETLLVSAALAINRLVSRDGLFDIRYLGLLHLAILLVPCWVLIRYSSQFKPISRLAAYALLFLILTDVGYVAYFNSFYSETSSFVFLVGTVAFFLWTVQNPGFGTLCCWTLCAVLFVTAKPQNGALGLILTILPLRMLGLRPDRRWRYTCLGMAGVLAAASALYIASNPKFALKTTSFVAVFTGIMPFSPDPVKDLTELGLDAGLTRFTGVSPFEPGIMESPELVPFFKKMGLFELGMFYLRHPVRLEQSLDRTAPYALIVRPGHIGNFDKSAGLPAGARSQTFNYWGLWRRMYGPDRIRIFEFLFIFSGLAMGLRWWRAKSLESRLFLEFHAMLLVMAAIQIVTVSITMATVDATKQMFLFGLLCDVFFASSVVWLVSRAELFWVSHFSVNAQPEVGTAHREARSYSGEGLGMAEVRWYRPWLLALFVFFAFYYTWTAQPKRGEHGIYNQMADAFLRRHLNLLTPVDPRLLKLAHPYDPEQNEKYRLHDMSFYKGVYFPYFGPAAAVTLFAPYKVLLGTSLPDRAGLVVFAVVAYIAGCLLLKTALVYFFPETPPAMFYALCFLLGFANTYPILLRRPAVYELAIASGQCFLFLGLYLLARCALATDVSIKMAVASGLMLGLAVLARPTLVLASVALLWLWWIPKASAAQRRRAIMAAALPVLTALAIFGLYNYARFDSPFEFGIRYQLAGFDSTKAVFFNLARIGGNLYLFLIYPPKLSATFPFLTLVRPWLEPMGRYLLFEPVAGLLWFSPALVLLPLGIPFLCRRGYARRWELALFLGVLVFTAAALLFLDASLVAIMRYQADFAGLLFVPTALVIAGLWQWGRRVISVRVAYLALFCFLAAATVLPTGLAGLSSEYGGLDLTEPGQFKALQTLFGPVSSALVRWGVQP